MGYLLAAFLLWTLIGLILVAKSLGSATMTASPREIITLVLTWPLHLRFFSMMFAMNKFLKTMKEMFENE